MPLIAVALIIAAALGGGTAVAAQSSLPGDPLWNFKTAVNEGVQGALAQGDEAKANWDITVAADRLSEAKELAAQGQLDAKAQADIEANFDAHAKDVAALVAKLEQDGKSDVAAQIATRFQTTLAKGAADVSASATTTAEADIAPLLAAVRGTLDDAASLSAQAAANAQARGGNAGDNPSDEAVLNAGGEARLEGGTTTDTGSASVHTGTSVRGAPAAGYKPMPKATRLVSNKLYPSLLLTKLRLRPEFFVPY